MKLELEPGIAVTSAVLVNKMIDPINITNYEATDNELQELILFCIAVFNKNANQTAIKLEKFLEFCHLRRRHLSHFDAVRRVARTIPMFELVSRFKFGNTTTKSKGFDEIVSLPIDLRTCTPEELEAVSGIGMKTSRFFILHTRRNARVACLDTHVLRWLRNIGCENIPKNTPSKKAYLRIEQMFLSLADELQIDPAKVDLTVWNLQRGTYDKQVVGKCKGLDADSIKKRLVSISKSCSGDREGSRTSNVRRDVCTQVQSG